MMRRIKKSLCLLSVFGMIVGGTGLSNPESQVEKAICRTATAEVETSSYFDSLEEFKEGNVYSTIAKKKISGEALTGYESVSFVDDDYLITYEVVANGDDSTVTLNVYFDSTGERIIENFTGVPMMNANNEKDILFNVDGQHIFLTQLEALNAQEQCSWFGNILHAILCAGMNALSYLEPAIKILLYVYTSIYMASLYYIAKDTSYAFNYACNRGLTQPQGFVYGQSSYSSWKFGFSDLAYAGCEVIAGYNLQRALGKGFSLADTAFLYEDLGIEIGAAQGFFGSNPYQISWFLDSLGISYTKSCNCIDFISKMDDIEKNCENYYIILSRWNGEDCGDMIHTFLIDKDEKNCFKDPSTNEYQELYKAYNCITYYTSETTNVTDYTEYFPGTIANTFICAYFIEK